MTINKKVYLIITFTLVLLTVVIVSIVAFNFQSYGQKKANESANLLANTVKDGLTTMMVTGSIDKRSYFLDNVAKHGAIENIRVMRSSSVIGQYGNGNVRESIYDNIEKEVINSGKEYSQIMTKDDKTYLRVVIPYIAATNSTPDCLTCHQANRGDVLGAISMDVDLSDSIREGDLMVLKVAGLSVLFMIVSLFTAAYYIRPYIKLFDELEDGITQAYHGDFSYKIETKLGSEAGAVAQKLNNLSEIFLFKKTIERDKDKNAIYERLIYVFKHSFGLKNFWLIEIDVDKKDAITVYCQDGVCEAKKKKFSCASDCRALRTADDVVSADFANLCAQCVTIYGNYLCVPFSISKKTTLILNIEFENQDEIKPFNEYLPIIKNYLETAKPVLESKILMSILEKTALKDSMTGLYNRRFLENFIDKELRENSKYAVMMIDVDFFKMVNDTFGHDVGDRAIKALANCLSKHIKGSDIAIRYGGEEFVILVFDIVQEAAFKLAESIRIDFAKQKIDAGTTNIQKTISIGLAMHSGDTNEHWQSIKFADEALYYAKDNGRNKTVIFDSSMHKGDASEY